MSRVEGRIVHPDPAPCPANIFAALGDPVRLGLIHRLASGERQSIAQLGEGLPISRQAVTKHLHMLLATGLVQRSREGREALFALQPEALDDVRDWLDEVSAAWDGALARLKAFVEGQ